MAGFLPFSIHSLRNPLLGIWSFSQLLPHSFLIHVTSSLEDGKIESRPEITVMLTAQPALSAFHITFVRTLLNIRLYRLPLYLLQWRKTRSHGSDENQGLFLSEEVSLHSLDPAGSNFFFHSGKLQTKLTFLFWEL